jgi:hypothetical protein
MTNCFDIGIVGTGTAGAFACLKLAKEHKSVKVISFDIGRPPAKRKMQTDGFLGCLPGSDGKLYLNDLNRIASLGVQNRTIKASNNYFNKILGNVADVKTTKDKSPSVSAEKKLKKFGYEYYLNDYIQIYPKDIHLLSRHIVDQIEKSGNIEFKFDTEIISIRKNKGTFIINTSENEEYKCKKLIIAAGRCGWRWTKQIFDNFGIIDNNDYAKFGIRVECNAALMKEFSKSNCTILKEDLEIGPLSWNGTVIPEDHIDLAISAFRSNENRWKTDKVSFSIIGNRYFQNAGFEQTDRIGKLTFILANDRIIKEKITTLLSGKSKISIMPEYNWLKDTIIDLSNIIPDINKASFHIPTLTTLAPKINIGSNLETEVDGMFVIGESAGVQGILSAAVTGLIVADSINK